MNKKANKQSVIYALTGFQKKKKKKKKHDYFHSEICNILSKNNDFNPKVGICWFNLFLHDSDITSTFYYCISVFGL